MFNSILNVRKEKGSTSHDVVARPRGILYQKKIGYTGILDLVAEGVLPVCLSSATKLVEFLTNRAKIYRAVFLLGVETDSRGMMETIFHTQEVCCNEEELRAIAQGFVGGYKQIPPIYPVKKQGSRKLVGLARQGTTVECPAQRVEISGIHLEEVTLPHTVMTVNCGRGTYVHTLCHDTSKKLGCGGTMEAPLRTRVGFFRLEDVYTLSELEVVMQAGEVESKLASVEGCPILYPAREALPEADAKLKNGNTVVETVIENGVDENGTLACLCLSDGSFAGLSQKKGRQY